MAIKISHLDKLFTCFPLTVKYQHAVADDKTYLYFTDYWFLLRYTVIIYKFTQGNLGAKKNHQKLISVASQEKKSQIATLATDSAILDNFLCNECLSPVVFSTNKTGRQDITEILLKVALYTTTLTL